MIKRISDSGLKFHRRQFHGTFSRFWQPCQTKIQSKQFVHSEGFGQGHGLVGVEGLEHEHVPFKGGHAVLSSDFVDFTGIFVKLQIVLVNVFRQ